MKLIAITTRVGLMLMKMAIKIRTFNKLMVLIEEALLQLEVDPRRPAIGPLLKSKLTAASTQQGNNHLGTEQVSLEDLQLNLNMEVHQEANNQMPKQQLNALDKNWHLEVLADSSVCRDSLRLWMTTTLDQ